MRILITGSTKLAGAIIDAFNEEILFEKTYVDSCRVHEVPEKLGDYDVFSIMLTWIFGKQNCYMKHTNNGKMTKIN